VSNQLRASGRSGSATADALVAFAQRGDWVTEMLDAATEMTMMAQEQPTIGRTNSIGVHQNKKE
jgi:hypothetical protein